MREKTRRSDVTEKCALGTKQGRKQKKRNRREAERQTLICHAGEEETPFLLNEKSRRPRQKSGADRIPHARADLAWTTHVMGPDERIPHGDDV